MKRKPFFKAIIGLQVFFMWITVNHIHAQTPTLTNCYEFIYQQRLAQDSTIYFYTRGLNNALTNIINNPNPTPQSNPTLIIPVVVHIMHGTGEAVGTGRNISYAQILSQINKLNANFANDTTYMGQSGQYAVNTDIQFCLAKIPMGPAGWTNPNEPGVMRYATTPTVLNHIYDNAGTGAQQLLAITHPNSTFFPPANYLNIWTVDNINNNVVLGYAPTPILNAFPLDGIVMDVRVFGDNTVNNNNFNLLTQYDAGTVLSHEAGHYLNLRHTFEGGCVGDNQTNCQTQGDFICDTPPSNATPGSCGPANTCTDALPSYNLLDALDNLNDFMSYADDNCLNTFTFGQGQRMYAYLQNFRSVLVSNTNLAFTGVAGGNSCLPPILLADINSPAIECENASLNVSTNTGPGFSAVSWFWQFPGGTPSTSTLTNPVISYATQGQYTITLTAYDANGDSIADSTTIAISPCGGIQSTQGVWYFGRRAGVNFSTGIAVHDNAAEINNTIISNEAAVSVSDSLGNLIFYSDGDTIWDRNHQPAITNLFGAFSDSKTQIVTIPRPGFPGQFYLFHGPATEDGTNPIYYSTIQVTPNTITAVSLNDTLPRPPQCASVGEPITAVPHCNGRDYWLITSGSNLGSNNFNLFWYQRIFVYLVSPAGVTNPSSLSQLPAIFTTTDGCWYSETKASPDNKKIARAGAFGISYFDFDNQTGIISNEHFVNTGSGAYGCSFSPNNNVLYYSNGINQLCALDLTLTNPPPVVLATSAPNTEFKDMQLGPDSALYITRMNQPSLDMISNPNTLLNPGYIANAVQLNLDSIQIHNLLSIPNMVDGIVPAAAPIDFTWSLASCNSIQFNLSGCWAPMYTVDWDFGDNSTGTGNNPIHVYSPTGTYTVTMILSIDTFSYPPVTQVIQFPTVSNPIITGPAVLCSNQFGPAQYTVTPGYQNYNWSVTGNANIVITNGNTADISVTGNCTIQCIASNGNCNDTATFAVTLYPSPLADAGNNDSTCVNGVLQIGGSPSASGGTPPYTYLWSPASGLNSTTISNPMATVTGTQTYTLTVTDANGCPNVDVINLSLDTSSNLPPIIWGAIPGICDYSSPVSLTGYVSPSGGTFNGTGVTGTLFDPGVSGTGTFPITYTITNTTGCVAVDTTTITVYACCATVNGINTADQDRSSQYGLSFNNNTPTPVAINGTFYIDNNFNITGFFGANHIRMGPDAKIVIRQNCRLTAAASQFKRCDNFMWESIIIEPGGELVMSGCEVYDAKAAVTSLGGAKYTISGTDFFRNYIGLKVEPASGIHPGTIVSSNIVGAVLGYPPYAGVRSRYGIELTLVDSIVIGVPGTLTNENTIRDVEVGIKALTSKFGMVRNRFLAITQPTIYIQPGCCAFNTCNDPAICFAPQVGVAVWAVGGSATIGGVNVATDANRFKDCTNGILIEADAITIIRNNEFQNIESNNPNILSYSIWVRRCRGVFHWITDNSFATSRNGIFYEMNSAMSAFLNNNKFNDFRQNGIFTKQNPNVSFTIQSNQFNTQYTGTPGKYGIRVQNAVIGQNISLAFITGNIIKHVDKGIWLTKAPYSLVTQGNQVEFQAQVPSITSIGIQVQNSEGTLIDANGVLKLGAPPSNDSLLRERLYGISVEYGSFNSNVSNNNLSRVGSGIHFYGTSNYPSSVNCNLLVQNMAGIRMNNSFIGDQGAGISVQNPDGVTHDNLFTYNYTNNGQRTFYRNVSDLPFDWYCRTSTSNSPTTNPPSIHMDPPLTAMNLISAFPSAPQACYYQNPSPQQMQQQELALIALRAYPFDSLTADQLIMADQTAMKQLKDNPSLMSLNTPYDLILMDYYLEQLGESVERTDEVHRLASEGDTLQARIVNDGIVPANCIEASQKTVNTIYLKTWAQGIPYFTPADSALLYMVATENVNNCGTAVYDARVMLDLDVDDFGPDGVHRPVWLNVGNATKGKMYPNPASGDAVYERELKESENGIIEIMDLPGHVLLTKSLTVKTAIPASTLTNGIYLYRVYVNGKLVDAGKLTVLH